MLRLTNMQVVNAQVLGRWAQAKDGSVAIIFAVLALPILFSAGVAMDFGRAFSARSALQSAVDSAAIEGAKVIGSEEDMRSAAVKSFANNYNATKHGAATPEIQVLGESVIVEANLDVPTSFMRLAYNDEISVGASSGAQITSSGAIACLLALHPTRNKAFHVQGTNDVELENCWGYVNSSSDEAIHGNGGAQATADGFCTAGGYDDNDNYSPTPKTGCRVFADPYAGLEGPSTAGCTYSNTKLKKGNHTLSPGIYCGGLELKPQANVTFQPGVYVIKNGPLRFQAQTTASGQNVVFYFHGIFSRLVVKGGASVDFKGRTAGSSFEGFLFIQHPDASPWSTTEIWGGGSIKMDGVLYMPTQQVEIRGNGSINAQGKMWAMVAESFYFRGNGVFKLSVDAAAAGLPDILPRIPGGSAKLIN